MNDRLDISKDIFMSASAGTGKTYTLVNHYLSIFERAFKYGINLDVHNVVAITFTRKAAKEMKDRVMKEVDKKIENGEPGDWQGLRNRLIYAWISTIHSFCERIIKESAIFLEIDPGFQILSGLKRKVKEENIVRTYFEEHIDELQDLVDLIGVNKTFNLFKKSISGKRHDLTTSYPFENHDGIKIGDNGEKILAATRLFERHFSELVNFYETQTVKEGLVDFDEFMIKTRDLLKDNPLIRERYENRFKYILVDEFQDTDELQKEIIDLLHRDKSNYCFFVGDAKQSIYRFRGADVAVFNKTKQFFKDKNLTVKTLGKNWRSHPDLVDFQNRLFQKIMLNDYSGDYFKTVYDGDVVPREYEEDSPKSRINLLLSESSEDSNTVASYINTLLEQELTLRKKDGTYEKRKARPGDIAILLRKFTKVSKYEEALEKFQIPFYTIGSKNFYDRPEVAGPLAWLDIIVDPLDDNSFAAFLLSPCFGASVEEIALLKGREKHIYDALIKTELEEFLPLKELYIDYSGLKHVLSPSLILEEFIKNTDYPAKLATLPGAERMIANVKKMLEIAKELDVLGTSLRELSSNLKAFVDSSDESEATIETEESNSVKIMTVHKSKGLEFPIVIVADTFWTEKRFEGNGSIFFDEGNYLIADKKPEKNDETHLAKLYWDEEAKEKEEEKRTLYVALSRPREMLILSLNGKISATKPWSNMLAGPLFNIDDGKLASEIADDLLDLAETVTVRETPPEIKKDVKIIEEPGIPELKMIEGLKDDSFVKYLSPTLISTDEEFEMVPEESNVQLKRKPAEIGTLAHSMLEQLGNHTRTGTITLDGIINGGNSALVDKIWFNQKDVDTVKAVLKNIGKTDAENVIKSIEQNEKVFSEFQVQRIFDKYILVGIVDKIYLVDGKWEIVDFKFTRKSSRNIEKYRFQMKFYLYVLQMLFKPEKATIVFLKDGKTEEVFLENPADFEAELKEKIEAYESGEVAR